MSEFDFSRKHRENWMHPLPRTNMPHVKRILNQQVFLEESEPYVYDEFRKNSFAMDVAHQILS